MSKEHKDISRSDLESLLKTMDIEPENSDGFHENYEYWNGFLEAISRIKTKFNIS